ncbi:MAG: DUF4143 domain-containing protein [Alkalispirochaeta sp.]
MRALVDRDRRPRRYLVLGSASSDLLRQSGESLAGRIGGENSLSAPFWNGIFPLGIDITTVTMGRLWTMLAASNGSILNRAKFADPIGVAPQTIARSIDILESTFMVRVLRPYFRNTKKRLERGNRTVAYPGCCNSNPSRLRL